MKHVWRVENIDGEGPYRTKKDKVSNFVNYRSSNYLRHPSPYDDSKEFAERWVKMTAYDPFYKNWIFGFSSMDQVANWFHTKQARKLLHKHGFFISHYLVRNRDCHVGEKQVIFRRDTGRERMKEVIGFDTLY